MWPSVTTKEKRMKETNTHATIKREDAIMQNSTQTPKYNKNNNGSEDSVTMLWKTV